jgi:uncharacterized protein (DUF1778 family)
MAANRTDRLFIRVSDDERAKLQAAADARGLTLSAYVRMVSLEAAKREMKK